MFVLNIITNTWIFALVMIIIKPYKLITESKNMFVPSISVTGLELQIKYFIIGYFVLLAIIFLTTSWIRFKEREV